MTTVKPDHAVAERVPDGALAPLPLVGRLRLNLSALGITLDAPDLGERLCQLSCDNEPYGFEISAKGELIVVPPSGWDTGANEQEVNTGVGVWRRENGGATFPPTVMFQLPSGARVYARCVVDHARNATTPYFRSWFLTSIAVP